MARPLADGDVPVSIQEANIGPYNGLTIEQFGFAVASKGDMDAIFYHFQRSMFQVLGTILVKGDSSSASYFLAALPELAKRSRLADAVLNPSMVM
jgi:5-enolpyruvylshikimate-3-phosphate synthase